MTRLSLAFYGLPAFPLALLALPVGSILPAFYAEEIGLGLGTVALVFLLARLVDAVSDPLVGWLSDSVPARFGGVMLGRRRLWMTLGAPGVVLAAALLFAPGLALWRPVFGDTVSGVQLFVGACLIYVCGTLMIVPMTAWGADLSKSYHDRNRITGVRTGYGLAGTLIALTVIGVLSTEDEGRMTSALQVLAVIGAVGLALSLPGLWRAVPDIDVGAGERLRLLPEMRSLITQSRFRSLLIAFVLNGIANGIPAGLFLLYAGHVLEAKAMSGPLLLLYLGTAMLSVPFWVAIGRRVSKQVLWLWAVSGSCMAFLPVPFLGAGDVAWFAVVCVLTGFAAGADFIFPASMNADLAERDRLTRGRSRAGLFFALWGMGNKAAMGLAVAVGFAIVEAGGFSTVAGTANSAEALSILAFTYGWMPIAFKLGAIALMRRLEPETDETPIPAVAPN